MSKKDTLLAMLKSAGVDKLYYSEGFDFNADYPSGRLLLDGDCNKKLVVSVYDFYFDDGSPRDGQDLVVNMALPTDEFYDFYKDRCEEVLYVSV